MLYQAKLLTELIFKISFCLFFFLFLCFVFNIYRCVQVYNAYQTLLKGLASMLQVFHGIQKCEDVVDSKSTGEKSTTNDEQLDDPAANVKQNKIIFLLPN